jgi:hypothetical protein
MKLKNGQIAMYMIIGSLLTFFGMYLTKKLSKTEKYSREELESDLSSLIKEMEEDGILQQTT